MYRGVKTAEAAAREGERERKRERDVERDISLPARAKIISPGLARRNVRAD